MTNAEPSARKQEIYTHEAPWLIYGMNWSNRLDKPFRLALGSFIEEYNNKVEIVQLNDETQAFERIGDGTEGAGVFNHPYPTTKIMWAPETQTQDMLATTGDYLRLWGVNEDGTVKAKCLLNNVRNEWTRGALYVCLDHTDTCVLQHKESEFCAPLTSFDWNETDTNLIGTSSIDTTCTIWDIEVRCVRSCCTAPQLERGH